MSMTMKVSHVYLLLLLALLQITAPSSAQNTDSNVTASVSSPADLVYRTVPSVVTVAVGKPAEFSCGVPQASPNLTFIFYGSHGNYTLTCPDGHLEYIPQALYGSCYMKNGESLAIWTLKGTSFSDNGSIVVCHQPMNPYAPAAVLHVYDSGFHHATLIGCVIGAFFGVLLVAALFFVTLQRSESLQKCFRGKEIEDDMTWIVED